MLPPHYPQIVALFIHALYSSNAFLPLPHHHLPTNDLLLPSLFSQNCVTSPSWGFFYMSLSLILYLPRCCRGVSDRSGFPPIRPSEEEQRQVAWGALERHVDEALVDQDGQGAWTSTSELRGWPSSKGRTMRHALLASASWQMSWYMLLLEKMVGSRIS